MYFVDDYNKATREMTRNKHLYTMYGLELPDSAGAPQWIAEDDAQRFLNAIHPEDLDRVRRSFGDAVDGVNGGWYDVTYRAVHQGTGKVVTLRSHVETHTNADGTESLIAIVQDITEICRMQQLEAEHKQKTEQLQAGLTAVSCSP
jgi:PAS fold